VVALVQLIGLDEAGDFLVEHCVPPPVTDSSLPLSPQARSSSVVKTQDKQSGNESLPINVVADQLRPHPKLLHWYLHEIFTKKPEMYVKFPRTAVPPRSVTELHRLHLELYVQYTDKRDSAEALSGTEAYNLDRMTTPLLSFLKVSIISMHGVALLQSFSKELYSNDLHHVCRPHCHWAAFDRMTLVVCWNPSELETGRVLLSRTLSNIRVTLPLS
jgi:hypothetical protein